MAKTMIDGKGYAATLEREAAARLLQEAISAEPDYSEEDNARIARDRITRLNRDALDACSSRILGRPDGEALPALSQHRQSLKGEQ